MDVTRQSKGGSARARSLSSEERREIAKTAAQARWAKVDDPNTLPNASHQGVLTIGDVGVEVYRLYDGRRLIAKAAMAKALNSQIGGRERVFANRNSQGGTIRDQRKPMAKDR